MPLIIADGATNITDANSYVTLAEVRAYNAARGIIIPVDDDEASALIVKAFDYIEALDDQFSGWRANAGQWTSWPRMGVFINDGATYVEPSSIPVGVKLAQCALAGIAITTDLAPVAAGRAVIEETIGPLTTKYSATQGNVGIPRISTVDALLRPYFRQRVGAIRSVRL